jgi:class 3 adenylate cyclase/YHS domain-containing protein
VATSQGDLLGMFEELVPAADATVDLFEAAMELGIDDAVIDELAELLDWRDIGAGTQADVDALRVLARALSLGMPHDALMQLLRVLLDATDRLADGVIRTFHNLHMGAHHGTLLYREGDYVGSTVNLTARVASAGSAGQFLITEELRDAVDGVVDADFSPLPPRRLKGIPNPIRLAEIRRRTPVRTDRLTDPVCGMLLSLDDVVIRTVWGGTTFAFCSDMCKQAFIDDPGHFTAAQPH